MPDDRDDILDRWQSQATESFRMTPEEIRKRTEHLENRLRRRERSGYMVCAFLFIVFGVWMVVSAHPIETMGSLLVMIAVAYLAYRIRHNRFRETPAASIANTATVDFLRTELARQRDFHSGRQFWWGWIILFTAGIVFFSGFADAHPEVIGMIRFEVISFLVLAFLAIPLNLWLARRYQREIDVLDQLSGDQQ